MDGRWGRVLLLADRRTEVVEQLGLEPVDLETEADCQLLVGIRALDPVEDEAHQVAGLCDEQVLGRDCRLLDDLQDRLEVARHVRRHLGDLGVLD